VEHDGSGDVDRLPDPVKPGDPLDNLGLDLGIGEDRLGARVR